MSAPTRQTTFQRHRLAFVAAIVLVGTTLGLFAVEWLLGMGAPPAEPPPGTYRYIRLAEHRPSASAVLTPSGAFPSVEQKEYPLEIDADGFIEPSKVHDDPDFTIAFLGGSTTECMLVDRDKRFPHLVGRVLEPEVGKVNAYNCGKAGAHSLNSLNTLVNKLLPLQPDVVAMMHNVNDLIMLLYEGTYWNDNPFRALVVERKAPPETVPGLAKKLVRTLFPNIVARLRPPSTEPVDPFADLRGQKLEIDEQALTAAFSRSLATFVAVCRANGITPVLLTQPNRLVENPDELVRHHTEKLERDFGIDYARYRGLWKLFNDTIREVGAAQEVEVIDLAAELPREDTFMYDLCHYNNRGSVRVAEIIARELLARGIAKPE